MTRSRECALVAPMLTAREGELSAEEERLLDLHLASCDGCAALAADLAATEGLVSEALLAEAARRDFAPFVDGVMEKVGASARPERSRARRGGVEGRTGWWPALTDWARAHRAAALAGTLAPTLAAAALIVYFSTSGAPAAPLAGEVEVESEGQVAMVLQTSEGPMVLLGEPDGT